MKSGYAKFHPTLKLCTHTHNVFLFLDCPVNEICYPPPPPELTVDLLGGLCKQQYSFIYGKIKWNINFFNLELNNLFSFFLFLCFLLFSRAQKKWLSLLLKINHPNFFSESSYGILSSSFVNKTLIQPPGEPQGHHLGELRPKNFELHKISNKTKWLDGSIYIGKVKTGFF